MKTPGKTLVGDGRETPGRILAGDARETPATLVPGASPGPWLGPRPPMFRCPSAIPMRQPARELGKHLHGSLQLLGQLVKHLRGGMQTFVKTRSLHQHNSQPASMALHASSAWMRVEARRGSNGRDELCCRP